MPAPGSQQSSPEVRELDRVRQDLVAIEGRLLVVERAYSQRAEPAEQEELRRRFSDAEIQFLLNNHSSASVLLYDLTSSAAFRSLPEYPDALYMLGESLYQQQSYLSARLYFREHMNLRGSHTRDALARYIELSGKLNEFAGIDTYLEQAKGPGGKLPGDISYVYGKWLLRRTDIPEQERLARAQDVFASLADTGGILAQQSTYFLGVIALQQSDLARAAFYFERVLRLQANGERDKRLNELANLSLARTYFELGKYSEAIDRYQEIDYDSDYFVDALYEIAWAHVRQAKQGGTDEYEKANQACEKLLLTAPDSLIAPEAQILQAHLLLKLGKYQEANEVYTSVTRSYSEVYSHIDSRLRAHADPVRYFQQAIRDSGKTFDITAILPPAAVKWASTQRDIAEAMKMTGDIDESKKGVGDSNEIATRLLEVLDKRELEVFPQFQEGLDRAEAVDAALTRCEGDLLKLEEQNAGSIRLDGVRQELEQIHQERARLEERFKDLPKSESEIEAHKQAMSKRLGELDQASFRLGYQVESLYAVLAALEKFVADTRDQRPSDPGAEREFAERLVREREVANQMREELAILQRQIRDEKVHLNVGSSGDAELRARYQELLARQGGLLATLRAGMPEPQLALVRRIDEQRATISRLRARSDSAKTTLRASVRAKAEALREKVRTEARLLKAYEGEVLAAAGKAQNLVGSIAYESFKRVRKQFYDLVLKADVGIIDVAWTRKQDKTDHIQNLAKEKDKELKGLDEEFQEVLKDVE
jgi:tetratricopeptide (TPR) repeat protein